MSALHAAQSAMFNDLNDSGVASRELANDLKGVLAQLETLSSRTTDVKSAPPLLIGSHAARFWNDKVWRTVRRTQF